MPILRMSISALIAFSLDRLSKVVIISQLNLVSVHKIDVWPPYLNFVMAWNTGVNFGFLSNYSGRWLLVALSIAVSLGMTAWVKNKRGWILPIATGTVVGGALGNAYDRLIYGAVADYLNMSCCGFNNPYSFNLADVFIFCGMAFIAIDYKAKTPLR